MKQMPISTDQFDAVKRCFDAYGADITRWPTDAREQYGSTARSDELADTRHDAEALDGLLGAATPPPVSAELKNRIIAQYRRPPAVMTISDLLADLFTPRRFVPAGAFAGIGALGLVAGVFSVNASFAMTPEVEAYAYVYADSGISLDTFDEEEAVQWDED